LGFIVFFEIGEVHQNLDNEKGGISRPSKNADAFFLSSRSDDLSEFEVSRVFKPEK